jgi:hypothetical protein
MELRIKDLREAIAQIIGRDLVVDGFKLDKSLTCFTKKSKNSKFKICIICYDYKPVRIEFQLIFQIWIDEIVKETEKFHLYLNEPFSKDWPTFSFCEGDFRSETKHLAAKFRNAYTHIITKPTEIEKEVLICKELLSQEVFPSLHRFLDFPVFQTYVFDNYKNTNDRSLVKASLITMKLKGDSELKQIVDYYWNDCNFKDYGVDDIFKKYAENIILYSNSH